MGTPEWIIGFVVETLFLLWMLGGGARLLEGTFASGCLISWLTPTWDAEQIRLYAFVALMASAVWFVLGLIEPGLRPF